MQSDKLTDEFFSYQLPKKILFGVGVSKKVGSETKTLGGRKILFVTDRNLRRLGITRNIEDALTTEGFDLELFSDVEAEPNLEVAEAAADAGRKKEYDIVVGVGGWQRPRYG